MHHIPTRSVCNGIRSALWSRVPQGLYYWLVNSVLAPLTVITTSLTPNSIVDIIHLKISESTLCFATHTCPTCTTKIKKATYFEKFIITKSVSSAKGGNGSPEVFWERNLCEDAKLRYPIAYQQPWVMFNATKLYVISGRKRNPVRYAGWDRYIWNFERRRSIS